MGVGEPLLAFEDLHFAYGDGSVVFEGVDCGIEEGEFAVLLAPNGGGKSTFLKLMCGLLEPTGGSVRYRGREVGSYGDEELFSEVGFLFQNPDDQLFGATVREDVAFGPRNLGLDEEAVVRRVHEALDDVELDVDPDRPVHRLSFGQRKRVALAGILAMGADTLLLDEPTGELDPLSQQNVFELLKRLNRDEGKTVVTATHHIDLLGAPFEKICVLAAPDRVVTGPPRRIFHDDELLETASLRPPIAMTVSRILLEHGGLDAEHTLEARDDLWAFLEEHFFTR